MDLNELIRLRDAIWARAETDAERAKIRAAYRDAGWTICEHDTCPPHDCRQES